MADRPGTLTPAPAWVVGRHVLLAALPLACGVAAAWAFEALRSSCSELVGLLLTPVCRGRQYQAQILFLIGGTAAGGLLAAGLGIWLELRRGRRAGGREPPPPPTV